MDQLFNYASFARVFEVGAISPNMTNLAQILLEPIVSSSKCLNKFGNPYAINNKLARAWYNQMEDIPKNIKVAAESEEVRKNIEKYFYDEVLEHYVSKEKEDGMLESLCNLIKDSNLSEIEKNDLIRLYNAGERGKFLGKALVLAVLQDNKKIVPNLEELKRTTADAIKDFRRMAEKIEKPKPLSPPDQLAPEEMPYVMELYRVYEEKIGKRCERPEDLELFPKYKENFMRQRKTYYKAETIRRKLRDTICINETDIFSLLKDEVYEGVVETQEEEYDCGFARLSAVLKMAACTVLSVNTQFMTLNWIAAGEKKGICHMLVNDKLLKWMDD